MVVVNESYSVCCLETEGVPICVNLPVTRKHLSRCGTHKVWEQRSLRLMYSKWRDRHSSSWDEFI